MKNFYFGHWTKNPKFSKGPILVNIYDKLTFKKQMMIDESALRIIKWQIKYYTPVPKKLKTCHFCKQKVDKWLHYMECRNLPKEIEEHYKQITTVLQKTNITISKK